MADWGLRCLLAACTYCQDRQWCASVTSMQALTLVQAGARLTHDHKKQVQNFLEDIRQGKGGKHWVYFNPDGKLEKLLRDMK